MTSHSSHSDGNEGRTEGWRRKEGPRKFRDKRDPGGRGGNVLSNEG